MIVLALAFLQAAGQPHERAPSDEAAVKATTEPASQRLQDAELILYAVELDRLTLTDSLTAYGDPLDPLLPLGELARLLDLDLNVSPAQQRLTGTLGEDRRSVIIDFNTPVARVGGKVIELKTDDFGISRTDMYVRSSLLGQVLPVRIEVNAEALTIRLTALEKLPIQARMERLGRLSSLGRAIDEIEPAIRIEAPAGLFSAPSFDVAVEGAAESPEPSYPRRYDVRLAGDFLYSNLQAYVGSDEAGDPTTVRMLLERRSAEGNLLGPIGATRLSLGDVFTPALAIGPRSSGGRGISFTTTPLEQASIFDTIDLRGELPIGFDAELYVNDVLRSGQRTPVQGRYEFLDVPLVQGVNVIRIVTYGSRGERSEVVRVINVGGGQLPKGATTFEFGLVQQEKALIDPRPFSDREIISIDVGAPRLVASITHGLTSGLTVLAGAALYSSGAKHGRHLATIGLRTSLSGMALQADAAADHRGGLGLTIGMAGQPMGISAVFRHSEYRGGFIDETSSIADFLRPPARKTALTIDLGLPKIGGITIPLSGRMLRDDFADGSVSWIAGARASAPIAQALASAGFDYERISRPETGLQQRLTGNFSISKFLNLSWQLRGALDYELLPEARLRALSFTADRAVSDRLALRFAAGQSFSKPRSTSLQAGAIMRFPIGDLAINSEYSPQRNDWRVGVRFAFGAIFDTARRSYVMTPPGPAAGASAILHSFIDNDGDGRFGIGDEPVAKIGVEGVGSKPAVSDKTGRALVTSLGSGPSGHVRVNIADIDNLFVGTPPARVEFAPRPGQVLQIPYPLTPVGEVYVKLTLRQPEGLVGLSAVRVRLVRDGENPLLGTTEFDGSVVFPEAPIGRYALELDPEQARRLGLRLKAPVAIAVTPGSGKEIEAEIVLGELTKSTAAPDAPREAGGTVR